MTRDTSAPEDHVVVVGGSAGAVEALSSFVGSLPRSFPCPIVVVVHVPSGGVSVLPDILKRAGVLPAEHAVDGAELRPGHILVAPPNHHVLLVDSKVRLSSGPRVNGHRPAVDSLFQSAARTYGSRAVGVILSGMLDDGADGLAAIARANGHTLVQHPDSALFASMPRNAMAATSVDRVVPPKQLAAAILELLDGRSTAVPHGVDAPTDDPPAEVSGLSCPRCHGVLWEETEGDRSRYRCRIGHAFGERTLAVTQGEAVEDALWLALRTLEERSALLVRMADQATARDQPLAAERFRGRVRALQDNIEVLRGVVDDYNDHDGDDVSEPASVG